MIFLNSADAKCPICGTLNKSVDLEETDGWMECENCGNAVQILKYMKMRRVPKYHMHDPNVLVSLSQK
jgi:transcription elongation factor Elf1